MVKPHRKIPALTQQDVERFWSKVRKSDGCWEWIGTPRKDGYGVFKAHGFMLRAPRVAYFISTGIDPVQNLVCHTCDFPACVRPDHLFCGDNSANIRDSVAKERHHSHFATNKWKRTRMQKMQKGDAHWTHRMPERTTKGEANGASKLTPETVCQIRQDYAAGLGSMAALGRRHGVNSEAVRKIIHRKTWPHVA